MAVIVNRAPRTTDDVWKVARWAFVWLLRQAIEECGDNPSARLLFERAIALDGLHLHLEAPDDAQTARQILLRVASRAALGELPPVEVEGRLLDDNSQRQFRAAAIALVQLLSAPK